MDWTERLPHVADALRAVPVSSVTIDGEIVATDAKGVTDFDRLRSALSARSQDAFLYAFDILELEWRGPAPTPMGGAPHGAGPAPAQDQQWHRAERAYGRAGR
jgi:bifunctional non-homologous end joining protein LigD